MVVFFPTFYKGNPLGMTGRKAIRVDSRTYTNTTAGLPRYNHRGLLMIRPVWSCLWLPGFLCL